MTSAPPPKAPRTDETPWLATGAEKRRVVQSMFAEIAPSYDRLNRLMSLALDRRWREAAVAAIDVRPGERALDLCCGTGDFLPILSARGAVVTGMDFCLPMLELAEPKASSRSKLVLGDAVQLPVVAGAVDVVTVGWGIRNVPDIDQAHREIYRVLRPGGRFVSVDMAIPRNGLVRWVSGVLTGKVIPRVGSWLSSAKAYRYLPESTQRFWSREQLAQSMERAGFTDVRYRDFFFGNICMHWGRK